MQSFIFLDIEGEPCQEMAALEISRKTGEIIDVFHGYAKTDAPDTFARKHVHGINLDYIENVDVPFPSADCLFAIFKIWMCSKSNAPIFANAGHKESSALGMKVNDFNLVPWVERKDKPSHLLAIRFKEQSIPIRGRKCPREAHSCFRCPPFSRNLAILDAKSKHGYHCALYDVLELYYEYVMC